MPARSERIYLFPLDENQPGQVMKFPVWWSRREFFDKFREREIDTGNPSYVDYAYLLTLGEALVWDRQCRGSYAGDLSHPQRTIEAEMRTFEAALKSARWVVVESYEWESGLD